MKIYVASSWRNPHQQRIVQLIKDKGHEVYDFRHPDPGNAGFSWSEIDPDWLKWNSSQFSEALEHPLARKGFGLDWGTMRASDACVMVLPCGRSAHIEAGYFVGAGKILIILLLGQNEPELMYKMATIVCTTETEMLSFLP